MITITFRRAALAAAAAVALGSGAAAYTPAATTGPDLKLTNARDGRTVTVHPGQTLTVRLTGQQGPGATWAWSEPAGSDPRVLRRTRAGATADGNASGTFDAVADGTAELTAHAACRTAGPGALCPQAVRAWEVAVDVVG